MSLMVIIENSNVNNIHHLDNFDYMVHYRLINQNSSSKWIK